MTPSKLSKLGAVRAGGRSLTASEKLRLIQIAVFSVGDTLSASEALSLIASVFKEDPIVRIERSRLAELLNLVTPASRKARR
jgi:hypothetical protein